MWKYFHKNSLITHDADDIHGQTGIDTKAWMINYNPEKSSVMHVSFQVPCIIM